MRLNLLIYKFLLAIFLFTFTAFYTFAQTKVNALDSIALVKLYTTTDSANWINKWNLAKPVISWKGVVINAGRVFKLDLDSNRLQGNLPAEIGNLSELIELRLKGNQIEGSIPEQIGQLKQLRILDLSYNRLRDTLPGSMANLSLLYALLLEGNLLTGKLPTFISKFSNLAILQLHNNNFSDPIPKEYGRLSNLEICYLGQNRDISGVIPDSISRLRKLKILDISSTGISGFIPKSIGLLTALDSLYLNNNPKLGGTIPSELGNLSNLKALDLVNCNLTGSIPNSFSQLKLLKFSVANNKLHYIPPMNNTRAKTIRIEQNQFTFDDLMAAFNGLKPADGVFVTYKPQDSIFQDTTILAAIGATLKISLGIDKSVRDNKYTWTKNGQFHATIIGNDTLVFPNFQPNDIGIYQVEVTNEFANDLKLYGRKIRIKITEEDTTSCTYRDRKELIKLYNATDGPNWKNKWDLKNPMSSWYGVTLSAQGCVTCLDLDGKINCTWKDTINLGNGLKGTLPNMRMSNLQYLFLSGNQLSGSIPDFSSTSLRSLDLSYNLLTGTIPNFKLDNLVQLFLFDNKLSGNIPDFMLLKLTYLGLGINQLEGSIPNFKGLPKLKYMYLFQNKLIGSIPDFNFTDLERLYLNDNELSGTIPNFKFLPKLEYLFLYKNKLTGTIPDFNNLDSLRRLYLYSNQLEGSVPDFNLPKLGFLYLNDNQLNGTIPSLEKTVLAEIRLQKNLLVGNIPNFSALSTKLRILWLDNNQLSGNVPNFKFPNLTYLGIGYNKLEGTLPDFELPNLDHLRFQNNMLSGPMPPLSKLTKLSNLYGQNNLLSGTIPNFVFRNLKYFDLSHNQFQGEAPNLDLPQVISLNIEDNNLVKLTALNKLASLGSVIDSTTSFSINRNRFTFDDILDNIGLINKMQSKSSYAPQDSIYKDTSITILGGLPLKVPLRIDQGITDNVYTWTKNGKSHATITGNDTLSFPSIQASDGGIYQVVVSNPRAPDLKLYGRKIRVSVGVDTNSCEYRDRRELIKLYNSTNGAKWTKEWDLTKAMKNWFGVRVNAQGCVTCLDLDGVNDCQVSNEGQGNNLTDSLPASLSLPYLEFLYIYRNSNLSGKIPNLNMPILKELSLSSNNMDGTIPYFNMPKLESLALASNEFIGTIPDFDYAELNYLSLNSNKLEGEIPNLKLPKLERIRLYRNKLSGTVPDFKFPKLRELRIHNNEELSTLPKFTSLIQMGIENITNDSLTLSNNQFTFKDIIPNILLINKMGKRVRYAPQAPFYKDTTFTKTVGQSLTINLIIDATIIGNSYKWYRVGGTDTLILNTNERTFNSLKVEDSGTYYVQVRNPQAPQLTLYSRAIQINVSDVGVLKSEAINQTSCSNGPISLNFNSAITYAADNEFRVELSESTTNFNNAINIGTLRSSKAQAISITLPTNHSPQKNYYYRIVSSNPRVVGNISSFKINLEKAIPAPIIKCAQTTGNSITFSWDAVASATGYQVRSLNGGGSGIRNGNSITFSNLASNTNISLEVGSQGAISCPIALDTQSCVTLNCSELVRAGQAEPTLFICENQSAPIILNDRLRNEDPNGLWSTTAVLSPATFDAEAGILQSKELKAGRYRFTYTVSGKNGCPNSAQNIEIVVGQKPKIDQQEYPTCLNANGKVQIQLSVVARSINQQYAGSIIWFRDANKKDTLKQASLELAAPMTIYAQVGQGACASSLSPILLRPQLKLPVPIIEGETVIKVGDSILLRTNQKYPAQSMFYWQIAQDKKHKEFRTIAQGRDLYKLPPMIAAKSDVGRYFLLVDDPAQKPSCVSDKASVDLEVKSQTEPLLKIGKLASKSSPWVIEGLDQYAQYRIQVFNRWGERVFQANSDYQKEWEGTYNGRQLPQGTYYYQINIPDLEPMLGAVYVL